MFQPILKLTSFQHRGDRERWCANLLRTLSRLGKNYRLHGIGFGLDEVESFLAQFAGIQDGMLNNRSLTSIKRISIVERNHDRIKRLRQILQYKQIQFLLHTAIKV
jgi:hypothetical protein